MNDLKKMEDLENDLNSYKDLSTKLDTDWSSNESVIETIEQHKKGKNTSLFE